jgi:hypothetical protein
MDTSNDTQQIVIVKEILRRMAILIVLFIICIMAILLLHDPVILKAFIFQASTSFIGLLLLAFIFPRKIKRASSVYAIWSISGFIAVFLLIPVSIWISLGSLVLICLGLISNVLGFYSYTQTIRKKFKTAIKFNRDSGFLDINRGICNLNIPLILAPPEVEKREKLRIQKKARLLYPFGPALGYYLSRRFGGPHDSPVAAAALFSLAYFGFQLPAKDLAIALELRELEKEIGRELILPSENDE